MRLEPFRTTGDWGRDGPWVIKWISDYLLSLEDKGALAIRVEDINGLKGIVSVRDYGAKGDGVTNDYAAISRAITAAGTAKALYFPAGTYLTGTTITIANAPFVYGDGRSTVLEPSAAMDAVLTVTKSITHVHDLFVQNLSSRATAGIKFAATGGDNASVFERISFDGFTYGFHNDGSDGFAVRNNTFTNCGTAIYSADDARNSLISDNYVLGGNGIHIARNTIQPEGVRVLNNSILSLNNGLATSTVGIKIAGGLNISVIGNVIDQYTSVGVLVDLGSHSLRFLEILGNWIGGGGSGTKGISTTGSTGTAEDVHIVGNTIASNTLYGVYNDAASRKWSLVSNSFYANGGDTGGADVYLSSSPYNSIYCNKFASSGAIKSVNEVNNTTSSMVAGNYFISGPGITRSTLSMWGDNIGANNVWNTYTPTVAPAAGALGAAATINNARYWRDGMTVHFMVEIYNSNNGTGSAALDVGLPFAAKTAITFCCAGRNNSNGLMLQGFIGGSTVRIWDYGNGYPTGTGHTIFISGTYEAN